MALKLTLPSAFTDTSLPKFRADPLLSDAGALFLADVAHPIAAFPSGVPVTGTPIPNLALTQAQATVGSGDASSLAGKIATDLSGAPSVGFAERSGKGGIHVATSQTVDPVGVSIGISIPDLVEQFIIDNPAHVYFISTWLRITRIQGAGSGGRQSHIEWHTAPSPSANYRAFVGANVTVPTSIGFRKPSNILGFQLGNIATGSWTGSSPTTPTGFTSLVGSLGVAGPFASTNVARLSKASQIWYRSYVEDLTVSGRSYADVDALDLAQFTKDCLTPGGRFYNDTFTAPSTVA